MEIKQLLEEGKQIWGKENLSLAQVIVRMGKVYGDVCRWERNVKKDEPMHTDDELKRSWEILFFQLSNGAMN